MKCAVIQRNGRVCGRVPKYGGVCGYHSKPANTTGNPITDYYIAKTYSGAKALGRDTSVSYLQEVWKQLVTAVRTVIKRRPTSVKGLYHHMWKMDQLMMANFKGPRKFVKDRDNFFKNFLEGGSCNCMCGTMMVYSMCYEFGYHLDTSKDHPVVVPLVYPGHLALGIRLGSLRMHEPNEYAVYETTTEFIDHRGLQPAYGYMETSVELQMIQYALDNIAKKKRVIDLPPSVIKAFPLLTALHREGRKVIGRIPAARLLDSNALKELRTGAVTGATVDALMVATVYYSLCIHFKRQHNVIMEMVEQCNNILERKRVIWG